MTCKLESSVPPNRREFINTNPLFSDSRATLKFQFCMLKNTSHSDFHLLEYWRPLEALEKKLLKYNNGVNGFQKFLCVVDRHEKTDF